MVFVTGLNLKDSLNSLPYAQYPRMDSCNLGSHSCNFGVDSCNFGPYSCNFGVDSCNFGPDSCNFGSHSCNFTLHSCNYTRYSCNYPVSIFATLHLHNDQKSLSYSSFLNSPYIEIHIILVEYLHPHPYLALGLPSSLVRYGGRETNFILSR